MTNIKCQNLRHRHMPRLIHGYLPKYLEAYLFEHMEKCEECAAFFEEMKKNPDVKDICKYVQHYMDDFVSGKLKFMIIGDDISAHIEWCRECQKTRDELKRIMGMRERVGSFYFDKATD